ncbi:hypothetical protein BP5796_00659 [Coleophoma crateriformis]|uniref:Cytochrome b561 domain-containing protein n=1 Tax=Coleophoma crateriformis TaxID=565419 RepID=A0A3D8T8M4_9HELO|nr:hypothetical protein BP5796_00659 [Coleophoma crateriformis]
MKLDFFSLVLVASALLGVHAQPGRSIFNQNLDSRTNRLSIPQSPLDKHFPHKRDDISPSKTQLLPRQGNDAFGGFGGGGGGGGNGGFSGGSSGGSSSGLGSGGSFQEIERLRNTYRLAHGVTMSVVVLLLFPLGALAMRVMGKWWLHATFQVLSILVLLAGFGLGVYMAEHERRLFNNTHTIFGTVLVALFVTAQPLIGFLQHAHFRRYKERGAWGYMHLWAGRILIVLGVVNGGIGLQLSREEGTAKNAYIAIAVVVGVIYILTLLITAVFRRRGSKAGSRI